MTYTDPIKTILMMKTNSVLGTVVYLETSDWVLVRGVLIEFCHLQFFKVYTLTL
jgi:hypothetical protein